MKKYFNIVINIVIVILIMGMFAGSAGAVQPPLAVLKIGGNEQTSGIGSYCWEETGKGVCADMIGIITPKEPLPASSHFTAHLCLSFQEIPKEEYRIIFKEMFVNLGLPPEKVDEFEFNYVPSVW